MLERRFVVDGADYTMRVAKGDAFEDISGLYYEWNSQIDISYSTEESVHVIYNGDGEFVEAYNWYDKELAVNYSVSVINDKPISNLAICIEQMIPSSVAFHSLITDKEGRIMMLEPGNGYSVIKEKILISGDLKPIEASLHILNYHLQRRV